MAKRRVVVTGLGVITGIGMNVPDFLFGMRNCVSGMRTVDLFDVSGYPAKCACQLPRDLSIPDAPDPPYRRIEIPALLAAREAFRDAHLDSIPAHDTGLIFAGGSGGILELENAMESGVDLDLLDPEEAEQLDYRIDSPARCIARDMGIQTPSISLITACSSGALAIGLSYDRIRSGEWDIALAGASDVLSRLCLGGFNTLRAMDPEPCKPFDRNRRGMNLGEGAGALVLESLSHARSRGVVPHAELLGYSITSDAYHITTPDRSGLAWARAYRRLMRDVDLAPEDIDYINAHGTATPLNDEAESAAIRLAMGKSATRIPISSIKAMIGHCQFAAGAIEAVAAALSVQHDFIPATLRYQTPDPVCDLDYVPNTPREAEVNIALSASFGFGGASVILAMKKFQP